MKKKTKTEGRTNPELSTPSLPQDHETQPALPEVLSPDQSPGTSHDASFRCVKCGACRAVCPSFLLNREESLSARGRVALLRAVAEKKLDCSAAYKDRLATCTGCLACEAACPSGVPVTELVQFAKEQVVAETGPGIISAAVSEVMKHPFLLRTTAWLGPVALHYARQSRGGTSRISGLPAAQKKQKKRRAVGKPKGRVAFFAGCAVSYWQQDIDRAMSAVLSRLGYEVFSPHGLHCCGKPLLTLGDRKSAEELAARNAAVLEKCGADVIVTACASCGLTFKREYPKLLPSGVEIPHVIDIHEFLPDALAGISLNRLQKTVTWHDPCHLGRGQGLSRSARDILQMIPGLTLVEMKNADRCCGFGGVMRITHRERSDGIAEAKAKSIIETAASLVVTGCPGCRMQITDALTRAGSDLPVMHTIHLLEEALSGSE